MPTTGIINGTLLRVYVDVSGTLTPIGHATSYTLDLTMDTLEVADKDNTGNWKNYQTSQKSGTLSVDAFYSYDTTNVSPSDLFAYFDNGTLLTIYGSTEVLGDVRKKFTGYITALSETAPNNELSTFNMTIQITGEVDEETIT